MTGTVDDIVGRLEELYRAGVRNIMMPQMLPNVVETTAALEPVVRSGREAVAGRTYCVGCNARRSIHVDHVLEHTTWAQPD